MVGNLIFEIIIIAIIIVGVALHTQLHMLVTYS